MERCESMIVNDGQNPQLNIKMKDYFSPLPIESLFMNKEADNRDIKSCNNINSAQEKPQTAEQKNQVKQQQQQQQDFDQTFMVDDNQQLNIDQSQLSIASQNQILPSKIHGNNDFDLSVIIMDSLDEMVDPGKMSPIGQSSFKDDRMADGSGHNGFINQCTNNDSNQPLESGVVNDDKLFAFTTPYKAQSTQTPALQTPFDNKNVKKNSYDTATRSRLSQLICELDDLDNIECGVDMDVDGGDNNMNSDNQLLKEEEDQSFIMPLKKLKMNDSYISVQDDTDNDEGELHKAQDKISQSFKEAVVSSGPNIFNFATPKASSSKQLTGSGTLTFNAHNARQQTSIINTSGLLNFSKVPLDASGMQSVRDDNLSQDSQNQQSQEIERESVQQTNNKEDNYEQLDDTPALFQLADNEQTFDTIKTDTLLQYQIPLSRSSVKNSGGVSINQKHHTQSIISCQAQSQSKQKTFDHSESLRQFEKQFDDIITMRQSNIGVQVDLDRTPTRRNVSFKQEYAGMQQQSVLLEKAFQKLTADNTTYTDIQSLSRKNEDDKTDDNQEVLAARSCSELVVLDVKRFLTHSSYYVNLQHLCINWIEGMTPLGDMEFVKQLKSLQSLYIVGHNISNLPELPTSLQLLNASCNLISSVDSVYQLQVLSLDNNPLESLSIHSDTLQVLSLLKCPLSQRLDLSADSLKKLALSQAQWRSQDAINFLFGNLPRMKSLQELHLMDMRLMEIPSSIKSLNSLERLNFNSNMIEKLRFVDELPSLINLDVSNNKLHDIGKCLRFLKKINLQQLYLCGNKFSSQFTVLDGLLKEQVPQLVQSSFSAEAESSPSIDIDNSKQSAVDDLTFINHIFYRHAVFKVLKIQWLDGLRVDKAVRIKNERQYQHAKKQLSRVLSY
ncbi:hypothetical protein MP228_012174 [Amoeboaphelidium protococcarum]|nr:hypothetical protein MP228_012174 [Amoeboaphelidium protococcarum]